MAPLFQPIITRLKHPFPPLATDLGLEDPFDAVEFPYSKSLNPFVTPSRVPTFEIATAIPEDYGMLTMNKKVLDEMNGIWFEVTLCSEDPFQLKFVGPKFKVQKLYSNPFGLEDRFDPVVFARDPKSLPSFVIASRVLRSEIAKAIPADHVMLTDKHKQELKEIYETKFEAYRWVKLSGDKPYVAIDIVDLAGPDKYPKNEHPRNTERRIAILSSAGAFIGTACSLIHSTGVDDDSQVVKATLKASLFANSIGLIASLGSIWLQGKCPKAASFMEAIGNMATVTGFLVMVGIFFAY